MNLISTGQAGKEVNRDLENLVAAVNALKLQLSGHQVVIDGIRPVIQSSQEGSTSSSDGVTFARIFMMMGG